MDSRQAFKVENDFIEDTSTILQRAISSNKWNYSLRRNATCWEGIYRSRKNCETLCKCINERGDYGVRCSKSSRLEFDNCAITLCHPVKYRRPLGFW